MGSGRRARESALQILFGLDWVTVDLALAMDTYWTRFAGERPASYEEVRKQSEELVHGTFGNREQLDQRLQTASHHWKLERMSAVDRNILRIAAYELLFLADKVPRKVAINEAIEIAKKFGNEDSSAFINGILDRIGEGAVTRDRKKAPGNANRDRVAKESVHKSSKDKSKHGKGAKSNSNTADREGQANSKEPAGEVPTASPGSAESA